MKKQRSLTPNYAALQAMIWAEYGFLFSYANPYLTEKLGLTDTAAGLIMGVATGMAFLLQPLLTMLADRTRFRVRQVLLLSSAVSSLSAAAALIPWSRTAVTAILFALSCVALQVLPAFANALGMQEMHAGKRVDFGLARGIGSVCFGLGAKAATPLIAWLGMDAVALMGAVTAAGVLAATALFPAVSGTSARPEEAERPDGALEFFRKNRRFAVLLVGIVLLYIGHNVLSNCMFRIAQLKLGSADQTAATAVQGTTLMIAAVAELPTMFLFTKAVRRVRCDILLLISCAFMTLRLALTLLLPGAWGLYLVQLTQLPGFALFAVSTVYYVGSVVEKRNVVKGQTYLAAANTFGCLLAYVLGGALIDAMGVRNMLLVCTAISAAGLALALCSTKRVATAVGV